MGTSRTSTWEHYDAAAIAIAATLIGSERGKADLGKLAREAYDVADALAQEAHRRKLVEAVMLYEDPFSWIRAECATEKRTGEAKSDLGKDFLWRMMEGGFHFGQTFLESIEKTEAMPLNVAARYGDSGNQSGTLSDRREAAVNLLKKQIA